MGTFGQFPLHNLTHLAHSIFYLFNFVFTKSDNFSFKLFQLLGDFQLSVTDQEGYLSRSRKILPAHSATSLQYFDQTLLGSIEKFLHK